MELRSIVSLVQDQKFIRRVQYVLIGLFVVVIGLDTYLALDEIDNNTISNVVQDKTDNGLFILTYFWGAIAVNLFFIRFTKPVINGTLGSLIIVLVAICFALFNAESGVRALLPQEYDFVLYMLSMVFGMLMGFVFWRQYETKIIANQNHKE